jgi:hypothetical protein
MKNPDPERRLDERWRAPLWKLSRITFKNLLLIENIPSHVGLIDRPASADSQTRNKSMAPVTTNTKTIATMTAVWLLLTAAARKPEITLSVSMIKIATTASK